MSIEDVLAEARAKGFTRVERHEVGEVYREALREAEQRMFLLPFEEHDRYASSVAQDHIAEQIDKWHRHGYVISDGRHRRP